jgi:hypothetical protein
MCGVVFLSAQVASAACRYAVTDLGVLPGATHSVAAAINSNGTVVGYCARLHAARRSPSRVSRRTVRGLPMHL